MKREGIDLGLATLDKLGLPEQRAKCYVDSGGPDLESVLDRLPISSADSMIDLGCGKGGAILTMATYPFARVDGVELSPALVAVAKENLIKGRISNATIFCADAAEFQDFDSYTFVYMYNPFPAVVMKTVAENVIKSVARKPRVVTVIYLLPACHEVLERSGFTKIREFHHHPLPFPAGEAAQRTFYVYKIESFSNCATAL